MSGKTVSPPTLSEVVTVEDGFRVTLPEEACRLLEITSGTRLLLTVNPAVGEMVMSVAGKPGTLLAEARMTIDNHPGVMARIAGKLAEENVNIIMFLLPPSTKETISGTVLLDISKSRKTLKEIESSLSSLNDVKEIVTKIL
ncbi:ACT domain-containing protein [Candidatus Bathyarchaeota archaeon]|nr:ACT domain-containing protein [Candidatus Bathyarchaeota archaeon]